MTRISTNFDTQRANFVESLHLNLKKQTVKAINEHNKFITLANSYINDGLDESESIELLMIDGLSKEAAESYVEMAVNDEEDRSDGLFEYSFQFEDVYGKIWSSFDINKTVRASTDAEAWVKVEEILDAASERVESERILSVTKNS